MRYMLIYFRDREANHTALFESENAAHDAMVSEMKEKVAESNFAEIDFTIGADDNGDNVAYGYLWGYIYGNHVCEWRIVPVSDNA